MHKYVTQSIGGAPKCSNGQSIALRHMKEHHEQPSTARTYTSLLVLFLLLILRNPQLLIEPRLTFEEAYVYWAFAKSHNWIETLMRSHYGYFSLLDNIVVLLASRLTTLNNAAYWTAYSGLIVASIPFLIIWLGDSSFWPNLRSKTVASVTLLFVGQPFEIWYNIVCAQFYLCVITFLILAETLDGRPRKCTIIYTGLVMLAGMTGVVSCFLTPLYLWRAIRGGFAIRILSMILACCSFLHLLNTANLAMNGGIEGRFELHSVSFYVQSMVRDYSFSLFHGLLNGIDTSSDWLPVLVGVSVYGVWYFAKPLSQEIRGFYVLSFLFVSIPSLVLSMGGSGGGRYAFPGSVMLSLMLQHSLFLAERQSWRFVVTLVVLYVLVLSGIINYLLDDGAYRYQLIY